MSIPPAMYNNSRPPTPYGVELSGDTDRCPDCKRPGALVGHRGIRKVILCAACGFGYEKQVLRDSGVVRTVAKPARQPVDPATIQPRGIQGVVQPIRQPAQVSAQPDIPKPLEGETVQQQVVRLLAEFKNDFPDWSNTRIRRACGKTDTSWVQNTIKMASQGRMRPVIAQRAVRSIVEMRGRAEAERATQDKRAAMLASALHRLNSCTQSLDVMRQNLDTAIADVAHIRRVLEAK